MSKKRGLGTGFGQLVESSVKDKSLAEVLGQANRKAALLEIDVNRIHPNPNQPRQKIDADQLKSLSDSIMAHGILQPIVVSSQGDGYEIISGERRYRAAKMAGLSTIPATVRTVNDQEKLEIGIVENVQREDLTVLDRAIALKTLREEFNMSNSQIADRVGSASTTVGNLIRLTQLGGKAREMMASNELSEGNARQLLGLDESTQEDIIKMIITEGWTIRQTENYVRALKNQGKSDIAPAKNSAIKLTQRSNPLTKKLQTKLKVPVTIQPMAKGGKLVIRYKSEEDLERISKLF